jgi:hypothetical protein
MKSVGINIQQQKLNLHTKHNKMVLKDILAISGEPGLFKFIAQGKNAIIVEHLESGKRSSAFSSAKVSSLEDISVFTENEDLPLGKVFDKISEKESGGITIDSKSDPEKLKKYFEEVIPDYSKEKVYISDIRKIFLWYNLLHKKGMLVKEEPEKAGEPEKTESSSEKLPSTEKKKKKSAPRSKV